MTKDLEMSDSMLLCYSRVTKVELRNFKTSQHQVTQIKLPKFTYFTGEPLSGKQQFLLKHTKKTVECGHNYVIYLLYNNCIMKDFFETHLNQLIYNLEGLTPVLTFVSIINVL